MTDPSEENRGRPSRLGRGLSSLLGEVDALAARTPVPPPVATGPGPGISQPEAGTESPPSEIPIELIRRNPAQPRRLFSDEALQELADSLKTRGVLQAILVRRDPADPSRFQIIAGERRWRAARLAGLKTIPAIVREVDELELLEIGIIENVQRSDLNPIEEAEAYDALIRRFGRTQESLASGVGKSRVHIANTLRLLQLPDDARNHVREGRLSAGHARAALAAADPAGILEIAVAKGLSVREVEALAKQGRSSGPRSDGHSGSAGEPLKDINTQALEADISRNLGLEVDIRHGPKGGHIRIFYRDLEQLDEVCRRLTVKRRGPD